MVLLIALVTANLPFITQRFLVFGVMFGNKGLALRFLELVIFYSLVGAFATFLENQAGQIVPQGWEFYAITFALFITLSFPGFTYRYLLKR